MRRLAPVLCMFVLMGAMASCATAQAQGTVVTIPGAVCDVAVRIREALERIGETRVFSGQSVGSGNVSVYRNAATGKWTLVLEAPNGIDCAVAAGVNGALNFGKGI